MGEGCTKWYHLSTLDTIQINKINSDNDKRSQVFAPITIWKLSQKKSYEVKCKVDTGAEGNILPISYFRKLYPEKLDATGNPKPNAIQPNEVILSAYGGVAITNLGQIDIPCSYNDTKFTGKFFVTDAAGPITLGLNTSRALKLITLHCSVEKVESPVTESHSTQCGINEPSASLRTKKKVRFQEATPEMGRAREKTNTYVPSDTPLQERPRVRDKAHVKSMYPECFDDSEKKPRYFSITLEQNSSGKIDALHRVPLELKDRQVGPNGKRWSHHKRNRTHWLGQLPRHQRKTEWRPQDLPGPIQPEQVNKTTTLSDAHCWRDNPQIRRVQIVLEIRCQGRLLEYLVGSQVVSTYHL